MRGQKSTNPKESQAEFHFQQQAAARLRSERQRLSMTQAEFAKKVSVDPAKQSQLETGSRELRGAYLAAAKEAGIDILFVITGERSESVLNRQMSDIVTAMMTLPDDARSTIEKLVWAWRNSIMHGVSDQSSPAIKPDKPAGRQTLHTPVRFYRGADRK